VLRRFLTPGWVVGHLLVLAAVVTSLRLGWWQWERSQALTGTMQNLGYSFLWPAFGAAFVWMWVRFLRLEQIKEREAEEADAAALAGMLGGPTDVPAAPPTDGPTAPAADLPVDGAPEVRTPEPDDTPDAAVERPQSRDRSRGVVVAATAVDEAPDDDPEMTAYNRALAALAEEDQRRARVEGQRPVGRRDR
jgi:DNA-binding transcriptional regulator of glucitol operon